MLNVPTCQHVYNRTFSSFSHLYSHFDHAAFFPLSFPSIQIWKCIEICLCDKLCNGLFVGVHKNSKKCSIWMSFSAMRMEKCIFFPSCEWKPQPDNLFFLFISHHDKNLIKSVYLRSDKCALFGTNGGKYDLLVVTSSVLLWQKLISPCGKLINTEDGRFSIFLLVLLFWLLLFVRATNHWNAAIYWR